jgi:hypothetical protein
MALVRQLVTPFVGRDLEVQPVPGWWWEPMWPWTTVPRDQLAPRFVFRLEGLMEFRGEINAGFGIVTTLDSPCSGFSIYFELRVSGDFDFERRVAQYNLLFRRGSLDRLAIDEYLSSFSPHEPMKSFHMLGYGVIGAPRFESQSSESTGLPDPSPS